MKAHQEPLPVFRPVTLVLESQAEVDGVFSLLNHATTAAMVGLNGEEYEALVPFRDVGNSLKMHSEICKNLNNGSR